MSNKCIDPGRPQTLLCFETVSKPAGGSYRAWLDQGACRVGAYTLWAAVQAT